MEIPVFRFVMGYVALILACPHAAPEGRRQEELCCLGQALRHVYVLPAGKYALTPTLAPRGRNHFRGPFFTAILTHLFCGARNGCGPTFFAGFAAALAGICLISFNAGANGFTLSPWRRPAGPWPRP